MAAQSTSLLRAPGDAAHRVTFFELFFDLVYVFAITQLSHGLLGHLDARGLAETIVLLLAVWWAWVYTTWATNWLNPDSTGCRLMLIGVMGAALIMAASIPTAFGDGALPFALSYAAIQVGRSGFVLWAVREDPVRRANFQRIVVWNIGASALWIAGAFASGSARDAVWLIALAIDYAAPAARFFVPGLGSSTTAHWTVTASYFSERFKLFVILALGESIIVTGATFGELEPDFGTVAAFGIAFLGSVAMWWIYFHRSADAGEEAMTRSGDPGRIARSAYTYSHLPIVAGIIVSAVGDELVIGHPAGDAGLATIATVLGGPALFLAGHALFKYTVFGAASLVRLVAVAVLAFLVLVSFALSPVAVALLATLVLVGVAVHETVVHHPGADTIFEAAGGAEGLQRLAGAWHERVMADEVVGHAFSHGFHADHTSRLAAYWGEALGGPASYSDAYGDETSVVRMHSGNGQHDDMDHRAIACFDQALADVGLDQDDRLREALHDYFAWATTTTMSRYHESADDVPDGLRIPRWSWDGPVS